MRDVRWLIGAGLIVFGFTGSFRSVKLLKDAIALGLADSHAKVLIRRLRIYRVLSLAFAAATVTAYLLSRPFRPGFWVIAALWPLSVLPVLNQVRDVLDKWKSRR